jgi:hypothetical protein
MKLITLLAVCIDVCIETENKVLKRLLYDYAKEKIPKNKLILLYIKIASIEKTTPLYKIMSRWIKNNQNEIIHQMIRRDM